jgi:TPR repeat protein
MYNAVVIKKPKGLLANMLWDELSELCRVGVDMFDYHFNKEAFDSFRLAAKLGSANAMLNLGECYFLGLGTVVDYDKMFDCYCEAAEAGCLYALPRIAECYMNGWGTVQNTEYGRQILQKARDCGDEESAQLYHFYCEQPPTREEWQQIHGNILKEEKWNQR